MSRVRPQGLPQDPDHPPGGVPDVRRRAQIAVRGQGAQPEEPGGQLFPGQRAHRENHGAGGAHPRNPGDRDHHRGGCSAAGAQPDQDPAAALQYPAARRQILSLYFPFQRRQVSAPQPASRCEAAQGSSISAPIPAPAPCANHCTSCRKCSRCASARTASSAIARAPACSTRSTAAPRPVSSW